MCGWFMVPGLLALVPQAYANATDAAAKAAEEQLQAASAEAPAQSAPAVGTWHPKQVDGVEYLPLEDIRSFYKLMTLQPKGRKVVGQRLLGNGEVELRFGPAPRELRIQERLCILSHPVQEDASGDLLISRQDVLHVIEPVLRPTYIANRRAVRTVVIDAAHGGHDTGTVTPYAREADVTLAVATRLGAELKKRGFEVRFTREDNQYLSPQARVDKVNAEPLAMFVSLHLNSGRSDLQGSQVYTLAPVGQDDKKLPGHEFSQANMALAMALQSALVEKGGQTDGGCRRAHYSLLNSLRCPSVMVELGYATNPEEGLRLSSEENQIKLANALAGGVEAFTRVMNPATVLQVQKAPVVEPPAPPAKVDPAPRKTEPAKKTTQPRKRATRRQPARKSSRKNSRSSKRRR